MIPSRRGCQLNFAMCKHASHLESDEYVMELSLEGQGFWRALDIAYTL